MATLVIRRSGQEEQTAVLSDTEATIGRLPENTIFVDDRSVSRRHALISPSGEGHAIRTDINV